MSDKPNRPMATKSSDIPPSGGDRGGAQAAGGLSPYQKKIIKWLVGVLLVAVLAFFGVTEPTNTDIPPFPPPEDGAATILLPAGAIQASQPLTITGVLTGVQLLYVGPAQPH